MYPGATLLTLLRTPDRFRLLSYSVTILLVIVANAQVFMIQPSRVTRR